MADRSNPYEAAFEAFVRRAGVPCVAVDEAKRAFDGHDDPLKNPDFLLYPRFEANLVVEVKGKRGKDRQGRRPWENWVTLDDLEALARWQRLFGPGFRALLVFAYVEPQGEWTRSGSDPDPGSSDRPGQQTSTSSTPQDIGPIHPGPFPFRGHDYWFWAIERDCYVEHLRSRGPAWQAVAMAGPEFRRRIRPLTEWIPMTRSSKSRPQALPAPHSRWRFDLEETR